MMIIIVIAFATASLGYSVSTETQQNPYAAAMATEAFDAFSVSNSNLVSTAVGDGGLLLMLNLE